MAPTKIFFCIGLLAVLNTLNAQEDKSVTNATHQVYNIYAQLQNDTFYVGVDGRFVMSFADESTIEARFYYEDRYRSYQKIPYRRSGDTIFLNNNSSQTRIPYSFCNPKHIRKIKCRSGIPVIVGFFRPKQPLEIAGVRAKEHVLSSVEIYYMDPESCQVYIPYKESVDSRYSDIIAVYTRHQFGRLYKDRDWSYYPKYDYLKIDLSNFSRLSHYALFHEFPLIVKGDSIFPVDKLKNYQCWIDNGFFFPIMTIGRGEPWKVEGIRYQTVGLEGTKFEF